MVDDGGVPPLPRRVPGASGSPRPQAQVELGVISEDLRQRVLTAIAIELERDEAERRRKAQEQDGAGFFTRPGMGHTGRPGDAADGSAAGPANGGAAGPGDVVSAPGNIGGASLANGGGARPANGSGTSADSGDVSLAASYGVSPANGSGADTESGGTAEGGAATDAGDGVSAPDDPDGAGPWPALPRRAPGTHGAPPPPSELRREYLPPAVLGRRLDPEAHTEPLPRIAGTGDRPDGPAATGSGQSAPSVFSPIRPAAAPPAPSTPATAPAEPRSPASGPPAAAPSAAPADSEPPEAAPAAPAPPGTASPDSVPPGSTPSAPAMPAGSAALAAASAPTMPAGAPELAAALGLTPAAPAEPAETAPVQASPPAPPVPAPSSSPVQSRPPAPSGYGWTADPGGTRPGTGPGSGKAPPPPAARPAAKWPQRSARPYRMAGVILGVVALVVAGVIVLLLSGKGTPGHGTGLGPPARGAPGAAVRKHAAAWVAGQVSRTAVVVCDPVMCQALTARGIPAARLYQLGPQTTIPLRSQVIISTAAVRAQFGNELSSVYAPAVLASFGYGPDRVDIRATAPHGAAAYRAELTADIANRRASGTQLLRSGRIAAPFGARHELAEGAVDGRLLIAIAQMAATHPMFIVDFGSPAPGADPDMPLRQADLGEDAHAHRHVGRVVSAAYVRSMVTFLRAQRGQFRPARVQTVHLADGAAVLRVEFTAPSPLGLLGPRA